MTYLSLEDKRALETAIATMQQGGVIAFPTDTVYGIGAALDHPEALTRIYDIKGRPADRPLPILVSRPDVIPSLTIDADPLLLALAAKFWPGPLTVVLTANPSLPPEVVAADGTVGIRVPDHSIALTIAQHAGGAFASTSANRSGEPPAARAEEIRASLGGEIDVILDGGIAPHQEASTVIRREGDTITVIREGAIAAESIRDAWKDVLAASLAVPHNDAPTPSGR